MPIRRFRNYREFTAPVPLIQKSKKELQKPRLVSISKGKYLCFSNTEPEVIHENTVVKNSRTLGMMALAQLIMYFQDPLRRFKKLSCHYFPENLCEYEWSEEENECMVTPYLIMVRLPDNTKECDFEKALEFFEVNPFFTKDPRLSIQDVRYIEFDEGLCAEIFFTNEPKIADTKIADHKCKEMLEFIKDQGYEDDSGTVLPNGIVRGFHLINLFNDPDGACNTSEAIFRIPVRRKATV